MNYEQNSFTYWSSGELRKLKKMYFDDGKDIIDIASELGRSENAIKLRLHMFNVTELANHKDDFATLFTLKKEQKNDKQKTE